MRKNSRKEEKLEKRSNHYALKTGKRKRMKKKKRKKLMQHIKSTFKKIRQKLTKKDNDI